MVDYKNIIKQTSFNYVIQIIGILTGMFFFVVITRYLTQEEYGIFSLVSVMIPIITHIASFNLLNFFVKDLAGLKTNTNYAKFSLEKYIKIDSQSI